MVEPEPDVAKLGMQGTFIGIHVEDVLSYWQAKVAAFNRDRAAIGKADAVNKDHGVFLFDGEHLGYMSRSGAARHPQSLGACFPTVGFNPVVGRNKSLKGLSFFVPKYYRTATAT